MSALEVLAPFQVFGDVDGEPLEDGYIYVGVKNLNPEVSPVQVYWDSALTIPAPQPIRTLGGYPSRMGTPSRMYVDADSYSISVKNKNGTFIYSLLDSASLQASANVIGGVQVVDSISDLRALEKDSPSKNAFVDGYYSKGDGGGGNYYYDSADTTSADNGGTIIVATDGGRWKLAHDGGVSLRQFGAKGDGVTGDTTRLQAAIDWASSTGVTLTEDHGATYVLDSHLALKSNVNLRGNGRSRLFFPANIDLTGAPSIGGAPCAMYAQNPCNDIALEGFIFESVTSGITYSIRPVIEGVTRLTIDNCTFKNFGNATYYAQGLIIFGISDIRVTNSKFLGCSGDGLAFGFVKTAYVYGNEFSGNLDFGFAISDECEDIHVEANICNFNTGSAIGTDDASSVTVIGNRMHANFNGFRVARFGSYVADQFHKVVANNIISASTSHAIAVEDSSNFTVTGNDIYNSGDKGILIANSAEGTVSANNIYGSIAEAILLLVNDAAKFCGNLSITGNNIGQCQYGLRALNVAGSILPCTIIGNPVRTASVAKMTGPFLLDNDAISDSVDYVHIGARGVNYDGSVSAGTATAGGVVPAGNYQGYLPAYLNGTRVKIPYFND